jgi:hypothetical protein
VQAPVLALTDLVKGKEPGMAVLGRLAATAPVDPAWTGMIADYADDNVDTPSCQDWGRRGGSHYKDGEFTKK